MSLPQKQSLKWCLEPGDGSRHRLRNPAVICCLLIVLPMASGCSAIPFKITRVEKDCPTCAAQSDLPCGRQCTPGSPCCSAPAGNSGIVGQNALVPPQIPSASLPQPAVPFPGLQGDFAAIPGQPVPNQPVPGQYCPPLPVPIPQDTKAQEQLAECEKMTGELTMQVSELKEQLQSNQRTNQSLSSALQNLNREVQRVTQDMDYWRSESQRQDEANRRLIEADRRAYDGLVKMLQEVDPSAGSSPGQSNPPNGSGSSLLQPLPSMDQSGF